MADAWDELSEAFDRGLAERGANLPRDQRDLYHIMDFIIDFEMGGWPANWMGDWERFDASIAAMRQRGLIELSVIVQHAKEILFRGDEFLRHLEEKGQSATWYEILDRFDPEGRLGALGDMISELDNYGLPESW